jgi:hypothetical protein
MGKQQRNEREHFRALTRVLNEYGITEIRSMHRTASNHLRVEFVHKGRTLRLTFSGSGDWMARKRLHQQVRHLIRGIYQQRSKVIA